MNEWSYIIICANMINIFINLKLLSLVDSESGGIIKLMGLSTMMLWFSLNKYLTY